MSHTSLRKLGHVPVTPLAQSQRRQPVRNRGGNCEIEHRCEAFRLKRTGSNNRGKRRRSADTSRIPAGRLEARCHA